jgi:DNA-binding PadR family transcriptional regulator
MSRELTGLGYVVLALIGRDGAGAHELVDMATRGQRLHWSGAASKVYEKPKQLEALGLVRSEVRPGRTRERAYYTLTDEGLAALKEWLARPSSFPRIQSEAVARVLASDLADDPQVVVESLQALREEISELSTTLEQREEAPDSVPHRALQLRLVRSLDRRLLRAHAEWIDEVRSQLTP